MNNSLKQLIHLIITSTLCSGLLAGQPAWHSKLKDIDKKIDVLLNKMTVEEKVGQMTQVTIELVSKKPIEKQVLHTLDTSKLEQAILQHHVGSILNVYGSCFTIDHWHEVIKHIQDVATKKTRLGIPILYGIDAVHGATYTKGATLFPQEIAIAATWNQEIAKKIGEVTAYEVRASGIPWNFSPVLDLARQPLWPRFWETFGEDVFLAKILGTSYIEGLMDDDMSAKDKLAPCLKHFAGYSFPLSGKDRAPAWIDERMLREYFLPTFEAGIRAGAPTVMVNSGDINGIPGHANYHLLTEVLKQEWNFQGFTVSDWEDIERLHTRDYIAETPKEAVRIAVMAGVDMSMVPLDYTFYDLLVQLVKEKSVPMSRIDDAVRRILRVKYLVGLFENPYPDPSLNAQVGSNENAEFNKNAAREAITLLKNTNRILPLKKSTRVLVTGPTANLLSVLNGGWTITHQGDNEALYPKDKPTILKAIQLKVGEKNVSFLPGTTFNEPININASAAAAETSDVVVVCLGEKTYCETPGNIDDLTLDDAQFKLVEEIAKKGKPIVLLLAEGRPRLIHRIIDKVQAVVMAYLPGMEGGSAIADILFGDAVPSGKLPFTYPRYPNSLMWYDGKTSNASNGKNYDPEFGFGFGLSYTTFQYSNLKMLQDVFLMKDNINISVSVKNTGNILGKEVVQLYVSDLYRSIIPPVRELKAFNKVELQPGESKTVEFTLNPNDLSFVGLNNKRIVEKGRFRFAIENLSCEAELK